MATRRTVRVWLLAIIVALVGGCDLIDRIVPAKGDKGGKPKSSVSEAKLAAIKVLDAGGNLVASFDTRGSIGLRYGGTTLTTQLLDGQRRYLQNGTVVFKVNLYDGKVKLKSKSGAMQWQAKFRSGKVKVSDNTEGDNAIELKRKGKDIKVAQGKRSLGKVKFYSKDKRIKVKGADGKTRFTGKKTGQSAAWGILLIDEIPEPQRYILMAEILAAGY
jgi:hypothetical protein